MKKYLHICFLILFLGLWGCNLPVTGETPTREPSAPASATLTQAPSTSLPSPTATVKPILTPTTEVKATLTPLEPTRIVPPSPTIAPSVPITKSLPLTVTTIHMLDLNTGWGIGSTPNSSDLVLRTSDGGFTWQDVTPPNLLFLGFDHPIRIHGYFQNRDVAWVIYQNESSFQIPNDPYVWNTSNGGKDWEISLPFEIPRLAEFFNVSDFQFLDSDRGWFIGHLGVGMHHDYMAIFTSADGGSKWERIVDPILTGEIQGCLKTGMAFEDSLYGWLTIDCQGVRDGAYIFATEDGGRTWTEVNLPVPTESPDLYDTAICGVNSPHFLSDGRGTITLNCLSREDFSSRKSFLYSSGDRGQTWFTSNAPEGQLVFINDQLGWIVSRDIHRTEDGGMAWEYIKTVNWDGQFNFIDKQNIWAVARDGKNTAFVKSINGGETWQIIEPQLVPPQ